MNSCVVGEYKYDLVNGRELSMKIVKIVNSILAISVLLALLSGCAKKQDRSQEQSDTNSESSSQSSTVVDQSNESEVATPKISTTDIPREIENADDRLQKQRDEVRQAFVSLHN